MMGVHRTLRVHDSGLLCTIQDLGRHGLGVSGVSPAGACDWYSARAANRLVGNADGAGVIEATMTGAVFDALAAGHVAVTGADAELRIRGEARSTWHAHAFRAGDRIAIGKARSGLRSYAAFDGGVRADPVLGSMSTDVGGGFGGRTLERGDAIELGVSERGDAPRPLLGYPAHAIPSLGSPAALRAMIGPGAGVIGTDGLAALLQGPYAASARSSRQAVRLEGEPLRLSGHADVISAGICAGAVQIAGNGLPIILLPEHQTTGGYAIALCVIAADVPRAAQLRPGEAVRFERVGYAQATEALAALLGRLASLAPQDADRHFASGFFEGAPPA